MRFSRLSRGFFSALYVFLAVVIPVISEAGDNTTVRGWCETGRFIYPAAAVFMEARAVFEGKSSTGLNPRLKSALRPLFGSLVDRIRVTWNIKLLDEWARDETGIELSGTESVGQAYGYNVYIRYPESELTDPQRTRSILWLLIHELVHVEQYEKAGGSLSDFGCSYAVGYANANMSYDRNEMERQANDTANAHIEEVYRLYVSNRNVD